MARKQVLQYYRYQCTLTGAKYKMTKKAANPDDLVSIRGYYELHPEKDDRPEAIKKEVAARVAEAEEEALEEEETVETEEK